jgi:DNA primase
LTGASNALRALVRSGDAPQEVNAILLGLLSHPGLADRHGESLAGLDLADARQKRLRDAMLDIVAAAPGVEKTALAHELGRRGHAADVEWLRTASRLRFSFVQERVAAEVAYRDFALIVDTVLARARIDTELATATARFKQTLADADFERQQALVAERVEIDAVMMRLAESRRDD